MRTGSLQDEDLRPDVEHFMLRSAIWPRFDKPMAEAVDALVNPDDYGNYGELEARDVRVRRLV